MELKILLSGARMVHVYNLSYKTYPVFNISSEWLMLKLAMFWWMIELVGRLHTMSYDMYN